MILDSVRAHTHPEFTCNLAYEATGESSPMLGAFDGEFSRTGGELISGKRSRGTTSSP